MEDWHEDNMLEKLYRLLDSPEPNQVELAYQLMLGMGVPYQEHGIARRLTNTGYKLGFCLRYGFIEYIRDIDRLYLQNFDFEEISPMIGQLKHLYEVEIRKGKVAVLPAQIGYLQKLWKLDLENNVLADLPTQIGYLHSLEYLNLRQNNLPTLPASIGDLKRLRNLKLDYNQITHLPEEIGDVATLELLDLSNNLLTKIPERLYEIPRLAYLFLTGNPINKTDIRTIREKMPKTKVIF